MNRGLVQRTGYLLPKLNLDRTFETRIPSRNVMGLNPLLEIVPFKFSRMVQKTENGTGSGIFSDEDISMSLRLPKTCKIFQAEIYALNITAKEK